MYNMSITYYKLPVHSSVVSSFFFCCLFAADVLVIGQRWRRRWPPHNRHASHRFCLRACVSFYRDNKNNNNHRRSRNDVKENRTCIVGRFHSLLYFVRTQNVHLCMECFMVNSAKRNRTIYLALVARARMCV